MTLFLPPRCRLPALESGAETSVNLIKFIREEGNVHDCSGDRGEGKEPSSVSAGQPIPLVTLIWL